MSLSDRKHTPAQTHCVQHIYVCVFVCVAERQNHARDLVREADLSQLDAVVIMSGDGLLYEVDTVTARP